VQTDHCCLIRRTNKAFLSILGLPHNARLAGMPLLVFLEKEERRRFTMAFLRFRRRELEDANEMFFQMRTRPPYQPFLANLSAHSDYGEHGKFLSMVWLFEKTFLTSAE
jgi:hypothetical protein